MHAQELLFILGIFSLTLKIYGEYCVGNISREIAFKRFFLKIGYVSIKRNAFPYSCRVSGIHVYRCIQLLEASHELIIHTP